MLLLFVVTTIGTRGFIELFPGFADRVYGRGPQGLAMLTSTVGLGAICGASWMVLRSAITGLANVVLVCTLIMSLAILAFTVHDAGHRAPLRHYGPSPSAQGREWGSKSRSQREG